MRAMRHIRGTHSMLLLLSASLLGAQTTSPQATGSAGGPDATIMAPVTALASYMARVEGNVLPPVFVDDGLVIVEDFAPYIFSGKDAAAQWDAGFRHHAVPLRDLKLRLAQPMLLNALVTGSISYSQPRGVAYTRTGDLRSTVLGPLCWRTRQGNGGFVLTDGGQPTCRTGRRKRSRSRERTQSA
jgi:hypothetical protein